MSLKILVADDDVIARKVLAAFLRQSHYEMEIVEDGNAAFAALTAPDAPHVAIVDWMMPGLSGLELCARLRAHPFAVQPYVIILSSKKEKSDIAAALDAGADDFITKPFNIQETQARLRAAGRSVQRQLEQQQRIEALEESLATAERAAAARVDAASLALDALEIHQIDAVLSGALRHCGLHEQPNRVRSPLQPPHPVAWASLLLPTQGRWLDLLLRMDDASTHALFAETYGRAPRSNSELTDCITKLHTALRDSVRSVLRGTNAQVVVPLPVRTSLAPGKPPSSSEEFTESHHYRLGSIGMTLDAIVTASPLQHKHPNALRRWDVLAMHYPPASSHRIPLLRAGAVLTEHLLKKLHMFAREATEPPLVPVHRASALAQFYQRGGQPIVVLGASGSVIASNRDAMAV